MLKNILMQLMFISILLINILLLDLLVLACEISGCKPRYHQSIAQDLPCKLDDTTIIDQAHLCGQLFFSKYRISDATNILVLFFL
ncbi:hypothetical protein MIMGU_mgv1a023455mg [Erythranthe guttata]|uniref:Secreted protein n=1 Tax=Erythranthe guttata TaxID=4155 RepID=A0A022Q4I7_ERYGU|nr:hypothetical protein MIMGU_mgv1a023455mg [Erythranthe guttata]